MSEQKELKQRIRQIYRDVVATTPSSTTFSGGRLKDAYDHGIHMVAEHTADLMVRRMIELIREVQEGRPVIVCLCGSTRFSEAFQDARLCETLAGCIVLSIGCEIKSDTQLLEEGKITLEDVKTFEKVHLSQIDLADEVLILNVNGYIGESTRREIEYAEAHGKRVRYLEHKMSS